MSPSRERRRGHLSVATAAGAAVLVGSVAQGCGVAPQDRDAPVGAQEPAVATSAASTSAAPATSSTADPSSFSCPQELDVLHGTTPIPDLAGQQRIVHQLVALDSVWVRHAAPSALGVVALVQDDSGDIDYRADPVVVDRLTRIGVAHTYEWDPEAVDSGADAADQVRQVLLWELDPAMQDVRREVRGVSGSAGLVFWPEGGAIVVQWKAPVPAEIRGLAGTRPDGVRVEVRPTTYSAVDVRRAQRRLSVWLRQSGRWHQWSFATACADGSGLVVGMLPRVAGEPGLTEAISEAVGMPVLVVPEGRTVELVTGTEEQPD